MKRFCYVLGIEIKRNDTRDVFEIYDRIKGFGGVGKTPIAIAYDVDDAQLIVNLLNIQDQETTLQRLQGRYPNQLPVSSST